MNKTSAVSNSGLFFRTSGPDEAATILFLHGGGGSSWMWEPVIAHLPGYHCLAPDLPEHGQSRDIGPFSMELAAEKAADVIREHAHGGRAHVVGLSEGAQTAVQLLATCPELVERAVISSALLRPIPGAGWLANPGLLERLYGVTVAPFRGSEFWIGLNRKYASGIPEQYHGQFRQDFQALSGRAFANLMAANQRFRLPPGLDKAAAPTLVVTGQKEYQVMKQSARDLAAALPDARAVQFSLGKKASLAEEHNWALNAPERFAALVKAWIEDRPLPDGFFPL